MDDTRFIYRLFYDEDKEQTHTPTPTRQGILEMSGPSPIQYYGAVDQRTANRAYF
jgi:hypothetical protein